MSLHHARTHVRIPSFAKGYVGTFVCISSSIAMFLLVFFHLDRALNFFDEGMYLYSITHPDWPWSIISDFGHMLHPLFMALNKDVYALRVVTFFALLSASFLCIASFLFYAHRHAKLSKSTICAAVFGAWSCTLGYYICWFTTASYNTLALVGVFGILATLFFYGALCRALPTAHPLMRSFIMRHCTSLRVLSLVLLAVFGVITFVGKATTGAGMGILAALFIYCCNKGVRPFRGRICDVICAGIIAFVLLGVYLFAFSAGTETIEKMIRCAELLDTSYSLSATLIFYAKFMVPTSYVTVFVTWILWALILWFAHTEKYSLAALTICITMLLWCITSYFWLANYTTVLMLWPLTLITGIGACLWRISWRHVRHAFSLAGVFYLSAIVYHAGTNTPLEFKMSEALVLPALAIVSLCTCMTPARRARAVPIVALVLCCATFATLFYPFLQPLRHKDVTMWNMTEEVILHEGTRPLLVHPEGKMFIEWLITTAQNHGWRAGTPLISTAYESSTALFLLDGFKVEASWQTQARYTPRELYARIFSYASPEDMQNAWILKPVVETDRHIPVEVLREIGLPFPEAYIRLSVSPTEALLGIWPAEQYELWKPRQ